MTASDPLYHARERRRGQDFDDFPVDELKPLIVPKGGHVPILGDMTAPFVRTASDFLSRKWEETPGR
jgi:hypothetical protein